MKETLFEPKSHMTLQSNEYQNMQLIPNTPHTSYKFSSLTTKFENVVCQMVATLSLS